MVDTDHSHGGVRAGADFANAPGPDELPLGNDVDDLDRIEFGFRALFWRRRLVGVAETLQTIGGGRVDLRRVRIALRQTLGYFSRHDICVYWQFSGLSASAVAANSGPAPVGDRNPAQCRAVDSAVLRGAWEQGAASDHVHARSFPAFGG